MDTDKTQNIFATALKGLSHLSPLRQFGLMVALAGSVALGVMIAVWSQTPNYTVLYGSVAGKDAAEVLEALESADIAFRLDDLSGAILVPSTKVHEARLKLAAQGLPKNSELGFELLDKKQDFGTSELVERARYQRALEGELARSIATLNSVHSARVHLAIPRPAVFLRDRKKSSASVLVQLYPGRVLEKGQVAAIAHLVAAAIPNLESSEVQVIDGMGHLLTSPEGSDGLELSRRELEYAHAIENTYLKRIEEILTPILGTAAFKAQVAADVDFTRTEQSREIFKPDPHAVRSEQVSEERMNGLFEGGIPGALSNQPPGGAVVPEVVPTAPKAEKSQTPQPNVRSQALRNYELDRTVSHTRRPFSTLRRLSVAVVLDDQRGIGPDGKATQRPRTPDEIAQITALVKEAIGFDAKRGDSLNVTNVSFTVTPPEEPIPEPPLWERPWVWSVAKQLGGFLVIGLLVLGVFRPLVRTLAKHSTPGGTLSQGAEPARLAAPNGEEIDPDRLSLSSSREGRQSFDSARPSAYEKNLESVKALVMSDPKRVASVVRDWLGDGG